MGERKMTSETKQRNTKYKKPWENWGEITHDEKANDVSVIRGVDVGTAIKTKRGK